MDAFLRIVVAGVVYLAAACGQQSREPVHEEKEREVRLLREIDSLTELYVSMQDGTPVETLYRLAAIADSSDGSVSEYLGSIIVNLLDPEVRCRFFNDVEELPEPSAKSLARVVSGEILIQADGNPDSIHTILLRYLGVPACRKWRDFAALVYADIVLANALNETSEDDRFWIEQRLMAPTEVVSFYYNRMRQSGSRMDSLHFYRAMPRQFGVFKWMFGAIKSRRFNEVMYGPLYDHSHDYLTALFATRVSPQEHVESILSLSIGARWDSDAVNSLHQELFAIIREHPPETAHQLSLLSDSDLESVATFLWDGSHVKRSRLAAIEPLAKTNHFIYTVLKQAFENRMKRD